MADADRRLFSNGDVGVRVAALRHCHEPIRKRRHSFADCHIRSNDAVGPAVEMSRDPCGRRGNRTSLTAGTQSAAKQSRLRRQISSLRQPGRKYEGETKGRLASGGSCQVCARETCRSLAFSALLPPAHTHPGSAQDHSHKSVRLSASLALGPAARISPKKPVSASGP